MNMPSAIELRHMGCGINPPKGTLASVGHVTVEGVRSVKWVWMWRVAFWGVRCGRGDVRGVDRDGTAGR